MDGMHILYERNFDTLLLDSVEFMLRSQDATSTDDDSSGLARASITFCLLMLEAAANTCLEHLDLEPTLHGEIDRLPVLAKFDFYLRTRFRNRSLERGSHFAESLKELKRLRDGFVHLKPHKVKWEGDPDEEMSTEAVRTPALQVATNPKFWDFDDAVRVSKGVHAFLRYFFKDKCKYGPKKVASLLFSESKVPGDDNHFYPHLTLDTKRRLASLGIDFSYIRLAWA